VSHIVRLLADHLFSSFPFVYLYFEQILEVYDYVSRAFVFFANSRILA